MPHRLVTYSAHAKDRMRSRSISMRHVALTLADPDRIFIGSQGNPVAEKAFGSATIRVVYVDRLGPNGWHSHVVTVMWK